MNVARRHGRRRRASLCALGLVPALGCNGEGSAAPPKSRVQAVMTSAPAAAEPESAPATSAPKPEPAPKAPRAPLCAGQLDADARPFRPARAPERLSLDPERELDKNPLASGAGRWTWINFWAAWCVPCKEELPVLASWQRELADELAFSFVSFDDDERQLRDFLEREPAGGLKSTYWLPDGPIRAAWLAALGLTSEPELPLQVLVDPRGRLRCRVQGAVEPEDLATLRDIVRRPR